MSNVIASLEKVLLPFAVKIGKQPHVNAIKNGFIRLMPLTLAGAMFVLINNVFLSFGEGSFFYSLNLQSKCNKKRSTHQLEYNFVSTQKPFPNDEYFLPTSYNKRARKDNDFTRTGQKTSRNCQSTGT